MANVDYLGVGVGFPLALKNGSVVLTSNKDLIKQSIELILSTPKGTRLLLPEYGSRIKELIFDMNDELLLDMLGVFITDAISKWEKRVKLLSIDFEQKDDYINCLLIYKILKSNEVDSFIYPFYKELKY